MHYADAIYDGEFTSQAELGAADRADLQALGIPKGAAGLIIAAAGGAGPAPDGSVALFQELLAKLDTLPEDAQAVSQLLKQGHLPVPHGKVEALKAMTKELVVGSSGKLADFFSNKIQNGGLLDATGKNEDVTGWLMLSLFVVTWTILQQFLPPERFLPFDYNKNKRVSATVGSVHDPTADNYCPDMMITTEGLLMFYGEEKRENMEGQALDDAIRKFRFGLSPLFYGNIPYLPLYTATGNLVRFHLLLANGSVIQACLQSASALHAKQLVHRDFRYANVLWDTEGPFVIDLEMAATPPLKDPPVHLAWTPDTLDNGCFTFGSDVFRIGVMLSALRADLFRHKGQHLPLDAISLLQVLKSKVLANEALQQAWLCS
ncbi:TPA: hypothetical protein ACH3X2_007408 [Trebouxia sp. C0005]